MSKQFATLSANTVCDLTKHHLLVLGGNGFVGSNVCQKAIQKGIKVRSLNRSGKPMCELNSPWIDEVEWITGDIFQEDDREKAMQDVTSVVSTIGAFGNNEQMQKICGDATIEAVKTAKEKGIDRFVFVSNSRVGSLLPAWLPMSGYFNGKMRAEDSITLAFGPKGICLRPGFIYGWRKLNAHSIPLQVLGLPMTIISRHLGFVSSLISSIPVVGKELYDAVPVRDVAKAAVLSAIADVPKTICEPSDIYSLSNSFHKTKM